MKTPVERNWTAQIVIASDHAGLKPYFKALENEILRVLARVDDPRLVRQYLDTITGCSKGWCGTPGRLKPKK